MAIVLGTAASVSGTSNPITLNYTCLAGHNCIVAILGTDQAVAGGAPSPYVYNGVTMLQAALHTDVGGGALKTAMIYYQFNPPTGSSLLMSATDVNTSTAEAMIIVSGSGFDTTRAPIAGTGTDAINAAPACSVSGMGANDIAFACVIARSVGIVAGGGATQTNLAAKTNINTLDSMSGDFLVGVTPANFSWTTTSGVWSSVAARFFAAAAGSGGQTLSGPGVSGGLVSTNGPTGVGGRVSGSPVSKIFLP